MAFLDAAEDIQAARLAVRASGVGAPQLRALLKSLTGAEPTFAETFGMLKGRETLTCDDFVAIYKGVMEGSLACAALSSPSLVVRARA